MMNEHFFNHETPVTEPGLKLLAHLPTDSFPSLVAADFWPRLVDADLMRIAVHLAEKSYSEQGCPIGAVIIDNASRRIVGKGHNTLVQENHPYNHGETSAMRDAGSIDFGLTTLFTTLTPCNVCACLMTERGFPRVVIGNSLPERPNNEERLRSQGMIVDSLFDIRGIELYATYQRKMRELDIIDWQGVAGLRRWRDQSIGQ